MLEATASLLVLAIIIGLPSCYGLLDRWLSVYAASVDAERERIALARELGRSLGPEQRAAVLEATREVERRQVN